MLGEYTGLALVSVVGKYRTGKSYFLNKVLLNKKSTSKGFEVGPTINACTKGLWIWDQVLEARDSGGRKVAVVVIDSEGLNSTEVDSNYDNRVFMFCLLLSSLFIYNSMGTIDENALQNINLILNLALRVKVKGGAQKPSDAEMVEAFPSFLWVLRDAFLAQEDLKGRRLTSKEYLESALKHQEGMSTTVFNKNMIRKQIKKFFPVRDCLRFVRPVEDESLLQNLDSVDDKFLRREFKKQIRSARDQIFGKVKAKSVGGQNLSPRLVLELARSYLEAINDHKELNIESSWKYVVRGQANKAKIHVVDLVGRLVKRINCELGGGEFQETGPEDRVLGEWAREAIYGTSWEVWKDGVTREMLGMFRRKCVADSSVENFEGLEREIRETVDERLQKLEEGIASTIKNRVKKKVRQALDGLGVRAVEGELSADDCRLELKRILVEYVEQEMPRLMLEKVQALKNVQIGGVEEAYERWVEWEDPRHEFGSKALFLQKILSKEREFRTLERFLEEKETRLMEQIIIGKERSLKRVQEEMKQEMEEDMRREREEQQRKRDKQELDRQRMGDEMEELRAKLKQKEARIRELELRVEELENLESEPKTDPREVERWREKVHTAERATEEVTQKWRLAEQKVVNLEMKEELLSNRVKVLTSDKNDLKGYFEDFMLKYKLDREETKVNPDREVERRLSEAVAQLTSRNLRLEEKLEKLKDYKTMAKSAASFECKLCYEQILDSDFLEHIKECATGRSRIIGRSGQLSRGLSTVSVRQARELDTSQRFGRSNHDTSINERHGFYETRDPNQLRAKSRRGGSMRFEGSHRNTSLHRHSRREFQGSRSIRSMRRAPVERDGRGQTSDGRVMRQLQECLQNKIVPQQLGVEIEHTRVKTPGKDSDSPFIFYEIKVFFGDQQSHMVYRKMRDFCSFCIKMEKQYREAGHDLEFLEEFKNSIDRMLKNRTQIQARKKILEGFLQDLVDQVGGHSNALFFRFLGLERLKNFKPQPVDNSYYQKGEETLHSLNVSQQRVLKTMNRSRGQNRGDADNRQIRGQMKPVSIYRTENDQFQIKTREFSERNESKFQEDFREDQERVEGGLPRRRGESYLDRSKKRRTGGLKHSQSRGRRVEYSNEDERYFKKLADKKDLLMQQSNLLYSQFESEPRVMANEGKATPEKESQGEAFYEESDGSDKEDIPVENEGVYDTLLESKENFHSGKRNEPYFESEDMGNTQNFDIQGYQGRDTPSPESEREKVQFGQTQDEEFEEIKQSSRQLKDLHNLKMSTHKQAQRQVRVKQAKPRIYRKKPYPIKDQFKY